MRWRIALPALALLLAVSTAAAPAADRAAVETHLRELMHRARVPGVAAVVVDGASAERFFLGHADRRQGRPPDADTSFELGSNSKAFTALAALLLAERGLLDLDAPVATYLPWLDFEHEGRAVEPRVRDFLYHTSGLPFATIAHVGSPEAAAGLEATVRTLDGESTESPPGERFSYATMNYDVLGLVVQEVGGRPYREFVRRELLRPLGLERTTMPGGGAAPPQKASGYKLGFLDARRFAAPVHPGHTPAAYVSSTLGDVERWLRAVLGQLPVGATLGRALEAARRPNRSVPPEPYYGALYAGGWYLLEEPELELSHPGSNPAFSSCMAVYPQSGRAIAVLANLNAYDVLEACAELNALARGGDLTAAADIFRTVDLTATVLVVLFALGCVLLALLLTRTAAAVRRGARRFDAGRLRWRPVVVLVLWLLVVTALFYLLPPLLLGGLPWDFVLEWGPYSLLPAVVLGWLFFALLAVRRFVGKGVVGAAAGGATGETPS